MIRAGKRPTSSWAWTASRPPWWEPSSYATRSSSRRRRPRQQTMPSPMVRVSRLSRSAMPLAPSVDASAALPQPRVAEPASRQGHNAMYIIVGGGGQEGYYLTKGLLEQAHAVLLLQKDYKRFTTLHD